MTSRAFSKKQLYIKRCCKFRMSVQRSENLPRCQQLLVQQVSIQACCLPKGAFCTHPLLPSFSLALQITLWQSTKSSSLESFIVKKIKIKNGEQNTCTYFETSLTFPWCFLAQPLSFLFSALRAPPNLVPPGTKVAPVHRCPHLVVMAPCRTDTVSPQGLYTLLSGSKGAATIPI